MILVVTAAAGAPVALADQVILDDLIVLGSECVGLDCVNGESFGFCTEILKENNTRMFFNDTSTSADFPRNDWEIVANDSNNGGANYLGFADRGEGLMSACGQGICEGSSNDGLPCDGAFDCAGVCVDAGVATGFPCVEDSLCQTFEPGGSCQDVGTCVPFGNIIFRIEAGGPEDSLLIDGAGDVSIANNLTVGGDITGNFTDITILQQQVADLQAQVDAILLLLEDDDDDSDSDSDD